MEVIRVVIAEDHAIVRQGLRSLLAAAPDIEVLGEAQSGLEALDLVHRLRPDVLISDVSMPGLNGVEATRQVAASGIPTRVLILTMHDDEEHIMDALRAGCGGYILKDTSFDDLISAVRTVATGQVYLSPTVSRTLLNDYARRYSPRTLNPDPLHSLTARERTVLALIAQRMSNREIAAHLGVSIKTMETHRTHLTEKLGIHERSELIRYARGLGLDSPTLE